MKERPILFSAPMVRAILDGRKTQTRRYLTSDTNFTCAELTKLKCRYGVPGDRLWVRESLVEGNDGWHYAADGAPVEFADPRAAAWAHHKDGSHCPSIHMPRWASRLTLEVTSVRVERLQDISEEDAKAEGIGEAKPWVFDGGGPAMGPTATHAFMRLWDSINGKRPGCAWQDNPWVWAVTFRRIGDG